MKHVELVSVILVDDSKKTHTFIGQVIVEQDPKTFDLISVNVKDIEEKIIEILKKEREEHNARRTV